MPTKEREKELLSVLYERSMDRVFELSANYLMTVSKKGCEEEFALEKEIAEMLEGLIKNAK